MDYDISLQTIAWFNERRNSESLEISPKFQRRAVWMEKERSELMVTILSKLPFPEIYVQIVTDESSGMQQYIIVDGQQRITSILKFIDGEVTLPVNSIWNGSDFKKLTQDERRQFWDYQIVVRTLRKTNDPEIRDLFQKLNTNNVVLNDQELRNARYSGNFKNACERLADDAFFSHLGMFTSREVRRMEDIEFISELLVLIINGVQNKKDNLEDYYANYNEEFPNETHFELEFRTTLNLLQQITTDDNQSLFKTKSNFYSLFGSCLKYYRETKKGSFKDSTTISKYLRDLFSSSKSSNFELRDGLDDIILTRVKIRDYREAVSKAASDRSRRVAREDIIFSIIGQIEGIK